MKFRALFLIYLFLPNALLTAGRPLSLAGATQSQLEPSLTDKLDKRIDEFKTTGRTLMAVVVDLGYEYQLPMGIEYLDREAATRQLNLEFHDQSLRTILAGVVAEFPEYRVTFSTQVVQIYSPQAREDPSNLFNKVIKDFSIVGADTEDAGLELNCSLSRELGISHFCGGSITNGQWGPVKLTLHLQNAKVYEILDAIIAQNRKALWTVTVPPEGLSTSQTSNLWHIFPLQSPFKETVLDRLTVAFAGKSDRAKTP